jgi:hypothetical protein
MVNASNDLFSGLLYTYDGLCQRKRCFLLLMVDSVNAQHFLTCEPKVNQVEQVVGRMLLKMYLYRFKYDLRVVSDNVMAGIHNDNHF